jgi:hypothetical protein
MLTLSGWICCANVQAAEVEEPFRVMILRSNSQYLPAAILQDRGMREAFTTPGTRNVEFFVETMDMLWFDRSEIEPEFLSLFRKKYGNRKIDLLMAAGVVNGTSSYDKNWARRAREALRLEVSYWTGQPLQQLLENLRRLPADAIVLYLAFSDGRTRWMWHSAIGRYCCQGYLSCFTMSRKMRFAGARSNRVLPVWFYGSTYRERWTWRCVCSRKHGASSPDIPTRLAI